MTNKILLEKAVRRKTVLRILAEATPYKLTSAEILHKIKTNYPQIKVYEMNEVKEHLSYLEGHRLIAVNNYNFSREKDWDAIIVSLGTDYLDGIGETIEGISRD